MCVNSKVEGTLKDILESHETSLRSEFLLYPTVFTVLILVVYSMMYTPWQGNKYIFLSGTQNLLRHTQFLLTNIPLLLIRIPRTRGSMFNAVLGDPFHLNRAQRAQFCLKTHFFFCLAVTVPLALCLARCSGISLLSSEVKFFPLWFLKFNTLI